LQPGGHGFEPRRLHTRRHPAARVAIATRVARVTKHLRSAATSACDRTLDSDWFRARAQMLPVATTPLGPSGRGRRFARAGRRAVWFFDNSVVIRVASNDDSDVPARGRPNVVRSNTSLRSRELDRYFALTFTRSSGRVARCVLCSTGPARGLEDRNNAAKLLRACGGCLGASRR